MSISVAIVVAVYVAIGFTVAILAKAALDGRPPKTDGETAVAIAAGVAWPLVCVGCCAALLFWVVAFALTAIGLRLGRGAGAAR